MSDGQRSSHCRHHNDQYDHHHLQRWGSTARHPQFDERTKLKTMLRSKAEWFPVFLRYCRLHLRLMPEDQHAMIRDKDVMRRIVACNGYCEVRTVLNEHYNYDERFHYHYELRILRNLLQGRDLHPQIPCQELAKHDGGTTSQKHVQQNPKDVPSIFHYRQNATMSTRVTLLNGTYGKYAKALDPDSLHRLDGFFAYYHRQWWCRRQMFYKYKWYHGLLNGLALLTVGLSVVVGAVWKGSFVMIGLTAFSTVVKGWNEFKNFAIKMDVSFRLHHPRKDLDRIVYVRARIDFRRI